MSTSKLLQGSLITVGWISRKHLDSGRGRSFFLTSLLIELIDNRNWLLLDFQIGLHYAPPALRSRP